MSIHRATVYRIKLLPHGNADSLSLARPGGTDWQCIVKTSDFIDGCLAAYIPIDMVVPEVPEFEFLRERHFRVRTIRLRGELSQGLLVPAKPEWTEGRDVTDELGLKVYEPPAPGIGFQGGSVKNPPGFQKYTDIENWKNYPNIILPGEEVVVTEKIHGTNFRFSMIDGLPVPGSHTQAKAYDGSSVYGQVATKLELKDRFERLGLTDIILMGEIYGPRVQKLDYGLKEPDAVFYDAYSISRDRYLNWDEFVELSNHLGLTRVPVIWVGPFSPEHLDLADGPTILGNGKHIREGIVIKPLIERWTHRVGRVILKRISDKYLLKDHDNIANH